MTSIQKFYLSGRDVALKKISIKSKLYLYIVPIIVIGIIASFTMLYYIANEKYIDYLNEQYEDDIEYLQSVSYQILITRQEPISEHLYLPDNCSGIRIYDNQNKLISPSIHCGDIITGWRR